MIRYLEERSLKAGRRKFVKFCQFVDWIGLGTYAPLLKKTQRPVLLDPTGEKIGLHEPGAAESVNILELLTGRLLGLYSIKACLREPDW